MQFRTDLAIEATVIEDNKNGSIQGVGQEVRLVGDVKITEITIKDKDGEAIMKRPVGRYVTAELPPLSDNDENLEIYANEIANELRSMLPESGTILVVGLGNSSITPDALGPNAAGMVMATRHIEGEFARASGLADLRPAAVMSPGVLGQTGVESGEIVKGVCSEVKPGAVIVIDALAARSLSRLGCTLQMCDTGIAPGSGVGNNRMKLNRETLGVPVIGMGVPTIVDARTIAMELTGKQESCDVVAPRGSEMMVTPREIDLIIRRASRLVAMTINAALQPDYSPLSLTAM